MKRTLIIAEAGVNHNGDINNAFKLVDAAFEAGADYVKFQTFKAGELVAKSARQAEYQMKNMGEQENDSQFEMLKKLELSEEDHEKLIEYCNKKGIAFLSTGFDLESLQYLADLGITLAKIPSGEITNLPYLRKVAALFKEVILSTGMATIEDIKAAIDVLVDNGIGIQHIRILHCNTEYPTPMKDVNLKAMQHIRVVTGVEIGYSDHTEGIEVPIAAVALGATVIEKHFTLDRTMDGPDHKASLEPLQLKEMVSAIRNIELAIAGSGYKEPSASEKKNMAVVRKSIIAVKPIQKGEEFTTENIGVKRPGTGISPMKWDDVLGTIAGRNFQEDELIEI
ncbi:N-acetylneuraminate synthase [Chitinophaga sp. YR573]|uniref:N-acetylneuraminate synthase n=1 Tax=Chitinophaga sp. YR573 TaxID=1881040 RepID=UPI0008AD3780|nr:N-acetylneuraminate synthase [Chitinophaga sp. YR573]SEW44457.1 N-acetylneuraminate synthase [Chitinophaga sp. YR573]